MIFLTQLIFLKRLSYAVNKSLHPDPLDVLVGVECIPPRGVARKIDNGEETDNDHPPPLNNLLTNLHITNIIPAAAP